MMYRTTSVLALGLFLGLAPTGVFAQTQTQEPSQEQVQQQPAETTQQDAQQQAGEGEQAAGQIILQDEDSILVSSMLGSTVYSQDDESIGDINDMIVGLDGTVEGVVIGVGGFLGMGQKDVAMELEKLSVTTRDDGEVRLVLSASKEELEAAPEFQTVAEQSDQDRLPAQQGAEQDADTQPEPQDLTQQDTTAQPETQQDLTQQDTTAQPETQQDLTQQDTTAQPETQQDMTAQQDTTAQPETQLDTTAEQDTTAQPETQQDMTAQQDTTAQPETELDTTAQQDTTTQPETELDTTAQQDTTAQPETQEQAEQQRVEGQIIMQDEDSVMVSSMIGATVYSETDEAIGDISDLIVQLDGKVEGVVVGVGGFLGIGQKEVAVEMERFTIQRGENGDEPRLMLSSTREELESAPEFQSRAGGQQDMQQTEEPATQQQTEEPATQQ